MVASKGTFAEEIEANKNAASAPSETVGLETAGSALEVRLRGAYITKCELTSPSSGRRVAVLYGDTDLSKFKLSATHSMVPAGPYEGIGGQHGFPRWADYDVTQLDDTAEGYKQMLLRAKRPDDGLALEKTFVLGEGALTTITRISNPSDMVEQTSMGEHTYYSLDAENFDGLRLNGQDLDELLGAGSLEKVQNDGTLYFEFGGEAVIDFPAGHSVKVTASFEGESKYPLAMWIWKRPGLPTICFEPVVGVEKLGQEVNDGVVVRPNEVAELRVQIELL